MRHESSANPEKEAGHDDANANPGSGASGPGERAYDEESLVGDESVVVDPTEQSDG